LELVLILGVIATLIWFYLGYAPLSGGTKSFGKWAQEAWGKENDLEHGPLIIPGALIVAWLHRADFRNAIKRPSWMGLCAILPGILLFVAAVWTQQARVALLALPALIVGSVWFVWGRSSARIALFPSLLILFIIPVGFVLGQTEPLQRLVAGVVEKMSDFVGIAIIRDGVKLVRRRPLLLTFLAMVLVGGLYSEGFDRLWQAHLLRDLTLPALGSLNPVVWFGIIDIVAMVLVAGTTEVIRRRVNMRSDRAVARTLLVSYLLLIVGLLFFALAVNIWIALAALWVVNIMRRSVDPLFSTWTNRHIDSNVRATVLSSFGQANALGQIGGGPFVGLIGDRLGIRAALSASALLFSPVVWLVARASRQQAIMTQEAAAAAEPSVPPVEAA